MFVYLIAAGAGLQLGLYPISNVEFGLVLGGIAAVLAYRIIRHTLRVYPNFATRRQIGLAAIADLPPISETLDYPAPCVSRGHLIPPTNRSTSLCSAAGAGLQLGARRFC